MGTRIDLGDETEELWAVLSQYQFGLDRGIPPYTHFFKTEKGARSEYERLRDDPRRHIPMLGLARVDLRFIPIETSGLTTP